MHGPRHTRLRADTAAIHSALERLVDDAGYFAQPELYRAYLSRMLAFHHNLDEAVPRAEASALARWRIYEHAAWLATDLRDLGGAVAHPAVPAQDLAKLRDFDHQIGALYVLVGSGLGACILARRVARFALPAGRGCNYLEGLCRTTSWPAFLAFLEAAPVASEDAVLAGAHLTFAAILDTLSCAVPA